MQARQRNPCEVLRPLDEADQRHGRRSYECLVLAKVPYCLSPAFGSAHCRTDDRDGIAKQDEIVPSE